MKVQMTESGFRIGPMTVEPFMAIERSPGEGEHVVVRITTAAGAELDIYCSPAGRRLRVFQKGKGELTPS